MPGTGQKVVVYYLMRFAGNRLHLATRMVAETGFQVDVLGADHIHKLGLSREQLLPTKVGLDCANARWTSVMGVFVAKVSGRLVTTGTDTTVRSMVYVINGDFCLTSRGTVLVIGCLPQQSPEIGQFLMEEGVIDHVGDDKVIAVDVDQSEEGAKATHKARMLTGGLQTLKQDRRQTVHRVGGCDCKFLAPRN